MLNEKSGIKFYELETLRGLASLFVFFTHFAAAFILFADRYVNGTPFYIFVNGGGAVDFFFVLSGFVLTYKYYIKKDIHIITKGLSKRYFRLAAPILIIIMISYLFFKLQLYYYADAALITRTPWLGDFGWSGRGYQFKASFLDAFRQGLVYCIFKGESYYNTSLWTMKIELFGSIIVFLLAPILISCRKIEFYIISILLFYTFHMTNPYYNCFLGGTVLALLWSKDKIISPNFYIKILLLIISITLFNMNPESILYKFLSQGKAFKPGDKILIYMHLIASIILVYITISQGYLNRFLNKSWGRFLGKLSFPVYLVHLIVLCSFSSWVLIFLNGIMDVNYFYIVLLTFILTIPVVLLASLILYRFDRFWVNYLDTFFNRHFKKNNNEN